ncbi:phosphodiester glycosidase family protein [Actinomadura barringtoniae]|uniref:Phosphodiester glycosidase family protein n=1 Tax=Actinomadura barringtoniae TaxID=1427535 RepID=A0A939PLH0_9ACTN|nr:phosphodiester glycosidase family protein [Actinomadura barringtoniae]MBO2455142.1 phosphodiester glycosidase family protein [Actinomadura barringtoniae]
MILRSVTVMASLTMTAPPPIALLAPGVTWTRNDFGKAPSAPWTVTVRPAFGSRATAEAHLRNLKARGLNGVMREVRTPAALDMAPRRLGYSVRVGHFRTAAKAKALAQKLSKPTKNARALNSAPEPLAADGSPTSGPWRIHILRADPGRVRITTGRSTARPETVRAMSKGALAGVNGGFFLIGSAIPGDPVGALIENGTLLSSDKGRRSALLLQGLDASVTELYARLKIRPPGEKARGTGLNALPGKNSVVAFTHEYGAALPRVPSREVLIDRDTQTVQSTWTRDRTRRGSTVPTGKILLQGTGTGAAWLAAHTPRGRTLSIYAKVTDRRTGLPVPMLPGTYAVGGNVTLVRNGRVELNAGSSSVAARPGPFYAMVMRRGPRTMAGIDAQGRILLVTVDGRSPHSAGMTLPEGAALMRRLGATDAVNLDGGGSTTMVVRGHVVNEPSDQHERKVGSAVLVTRDQAPSQRAVRMSTRPPSDLSGVPSSR